MSSDGYADERMTGTDDMHVSDDDFPQKSRALNCNARYGRSFSASFQNKCMGNFTDSSGSFQSSNFPKMEDFKEVGDLLLE